MRSILLLSVLAACAPTISVTPTGPSPRPLLARPASTVEIFTTQRPARAYAEIAVLSASKGQAADHINALREAAGQQGCDALIFTRMPGEVSGGGMAGGQSYSETATGSSSATCVVWTAP